MHPDDNYATVALTNVPFTKVEGFLGNDKLLGVTAFVGFMEPLSRTPFPVYCCHGYERMLNK